MHNADAAMLEWRRFHQTLSEEKYRLAKPAVVTKGS